MDNKDRVESWEIPPDVSAARSSSSRTQRNEQHRCPDYQSEEPGDSGHSVQAITNLAWSHQLLKSGMEALCLSRMDMEKLF